MPVTTFQSFKTKDGVALIDLPDRVCYLISGRDVTKRVVHSIDAWQNTYSICDENGNGFYTGKYPESCLYADKRIAYQQIIEDASKTQAETVRYVAHKLAEGAPA